MGGRFKEMVFVFSEANFVACKYCVLFLVFVTQLCEMFQDEQVSITCRLKRHLAHQKRTLFSLTLLAGQKYPVLKCNCVLSTRRSSE